ncbi:hypothetical protein AAMO2058_001640200 [Amorphochlora amoebiformis]
MSGYPGGETNLYKWTQKQDEVIITLKPPVLRTDMKMNTKVVVHGLRKAKKYNFVTGEVKGPLKLGRYLVECDDKSKKQLTPCVQSRFRVVKTRINVRASNLCLQVSKSDVKVEILSKSLKVTIKGRDIISGVPQHLIVASDSSWYMSDGLCEIVLAKQDKTNKWTDIFADPAPLKDKEEDTKERMRSSKNQDKDTKERLRSSENKDKDTKKEDTKPLFSAGGPDPNEKEEKQNKPQQNKSDPEAEKAANFSWASGIILEAKSMDDTLTATLNSKGTLHLKDGDTGDVLFEAELGPKVGLAAMAIEFSEISYELFVIPAHGPAGSFNLETKEFYGDVNLPY